MKYKYQLILLGENETLFKDIKLKLSEKLTELNLLPNLIKVVTPENIDEYTGAEPTYTIYAGHKDKLTEEVKEILRKQRLDGNIILPIFIDDFNAEIPDTLSNQNGLQLDNNLLKITNLILEGFGLLRKNRKIFISYKRSESSDLAIQLYEALEQSNFDVFLDTHSIDKGEEFQEELWHRMTDCDVVIMLNTKGFLNSDWCKQELEKAHIKRIGIVHVIWPDCNFEDFAQLAFSMQLEEEDFEASRHPNGKTRIKIDVVKKLINLCEEARARNLASRQDSLITEFTQAAHNNNVLVNLQYSRYITQEIETGKRIIYIPTIGVPQSINCHSSEKLISKIEKDEVDSIHLIYDEMSIRNRWLEHLDWLNGYLKIQTIKKQEFNNWFSKF